MPRSSNIYMLKDLARFSGQSIHTVKFYLTRGLIREIGRSPVTRYRYFDDSTLERLQQIRLLRKQRMSLRQIEQRLGVVTQAPVPSTSEVA